MQRRASTRAFATPLLALLLVAPTVAALVPAEVQEVARFVEGCFIEPLKPGRAVSEQYCVKAPLGTTLTDLLRDAPYPFSLWTAASTVTLGTNWEYSQKAGQSFQWWASSGCGSATWIGNYPSDWINRVSSAEIASGSGCNWWRHYDLDNQAGDMIECGRTVQLCTGDRMGIYGMDDRTNSMRILS